MGETILEIVSGVARRRGGRAVPEDDLRQELFVAVWKSRIDRGLDYDEHLVVEGNERSLLYAVCKHRSFELFRNATRKCRWAELPPVELRDRDFPSRVATPHDWAVAGELVERLFADVDLSQPVLTALLGDLPGIAARMEELSQQITRVDPERLWGLAIQQALDWNQKRLRRARNRIEARTKELIA